MAVTNACICFQQDTKGFVEGLKRFLLPDYCIAGPTLHLVYTLESKSRPLKSKCTKHVTRITTVVVLPYSTCSLLKLLHASSDDRSVVFAYTDKSEEVKMNSYLFILYSSYRAIRKMLHVQVN